MWFKKKSVLQAEHHYDTEKPADGSTDLRTRYKPYSYSSSSINSGIPSAFVAGNYFYLPALGYYHSGGLYNVGNYGFYWSSSARVSYNACHLYFGNGTVQVRYENRYYGFRVDGFE